MLGAFFEPKMSQLGRTFRYRIKCLKFTTRCQTNRLDVSCHNMSSDFQMDHYSIQENNLCQIRTIAQQGPHTLYCDCNFITPTAGFFREKFMVFAMAHLNKTFGT